MGIYNDFQQVMREFYAPKPIRLVSVDEFTSLIREPGFLQAEDLDEGGTGEVRYFYRSQEIAPVWQLLSMGGD